MLANRPYLLPGEIRRFALNASERLFFAAMLATPRFRMQAVRASWPYPASKRLIGVGIELELPERLPPCHQLNQIIEEVESQAAKLELLRRP